MNILKSISIRLSEKINEHQFEMAGCEVEIKKIQKTMQGKGMPSKNDIEGAYKIGILKDKYVFHKAAMMALQDFQKELENEDFLQSE